MIQENLSGAQAVKTAIHECAHALLHDPDKKLPTANTSRSDKEVQAESVAYIVASRYADNCFGERTGEERIRCADNVGLIMGYVRYSIYHNHAGVQLCGMIVTIFVKCAAISNADSVQSAHINLELLGFS